MIDWEHPRIYERLRCFGLSLFTLGIASHNSQNPPLALVAIVVTILLVVRLKIELDIGHDETGGSLLRKLKSIHEINVMAVILSFVSLTVVVRQLLDGELSLPRLN